MKEKRVLFLILIVTFLLTGCTVVNDDNYEEVIADSFRGNMISNTSRVGYKYYLPRTMKVLKRVSANEILSDNVNNYYLFVDRTSYFNKTEMNYTYSTDAVFSKEFSNGDATGYLVVTKNNGEGYYVEIQYNYAKIEVMVRKDVCDAIAKSMSILSSLTYQDVVIEELLRSDNKSSSEVMYNIFEEADTTSDYMDVLKEYGTYQEETKEVDPDFIRK